MLFESESPFRQVLCHTHTGSLSIFKVPLMHFMLVFDQTERSLGMLQFIVSALDQIQLFILITILLICCGI